MTGRRKKQMTDEEKERQRAYKKEYMRKYYKTHRERLIEYATNRYWQITHGLVVQNIPKTSEDSLAEWTRQLEERLKNEELEPMVRKWISWQIKWNNRYTNGKEED